MVAVYAAQFEDHGFEGESSESDFEGRSAVAARYTQADARYRAASRPWAGRQPVSARLNTCAGTNWIY